MRVKSITAPNEIKRWDWLLIIGLVLAPMTGFRVWKVGPAEILCLVWSTKYYSIRKLPVKNDLSKFFVTFLVSMVMGTMCGYIIAPNELVLSQWPTWPYLFVVSYGMFLGIRNNPRDYNEHLLDMICFYSATWYLFLYFYSITISRSFLGAPLWYAGARYTGGATNPHQVAVLMCGIVAWCLRKITLKKQVLRNTACFCIALYVELQTASSSGLAAIVLCILSFLFVIPAGKKMSVSRKIVIYSVEILFLSVVFLVFSEKILSMIYNWIASDANGKGRLNMMSQTGTVFRKSPLFGLGPGIHAFNLSGTQMEFHNTYSEILAATGIVGFSAFVLLTYKTVKYMLRDHLLIPTVVALYAYSVGGFAMRRLAYWGFFIFVYTIAYQGYTMTQQKSPQSRL